MHTPTAFRYIPELSRSLLAGLLLAASFPLHAALPGDRDTSFELSTALPKATHISAALKTASGQILAVFRSEQKTLLVRLHPNGQLDPDFQPAEIPQFAGKLALQPDGRILCGELINPGVSSVIRIHRFESNGVPDAGFKFEHSARSLDSITPLADGTILLGANFGSFTDFSTANFFHRLSSSGAIDPTFVMTGKFIGFIKYVRPTADGQFILDGGSIARISSSGVRDDTFLGNSLGSGTGPMTQLPDGRIVLARRYLDAQGLERSEILRLRADGSIDPEFTPTEYEGFLQRIAVSPKGRIILAGQLSRVGGIQRFGLARLFENGGVDSEFLCDVLANGPTPVAWYDVNIYGLEFLDDKRLLVAGQFNRVQGESVGQPLVVVHAHDSIAGPPRWIDLPEKVSAVEGRTLEIRTRVQSAPFGAVEWLKEGQPVPGATTTDFMIRTVQPSDAGEYTVNVATPLGKATGKVRVEVQPAITAPGSVDLSFNVGEGIGSYLSFPFSDAPIHDGLAVALGNQGRVYVAGRFGKFNGTPARQLTALKEDGSIDETFRWIPPLGETNIGQITAITSTPSGELYVSGTRPGRDLYLWKLQPDGTPDIRFNRFSWFAFREQILSMKVDFKGRLLVTVHTIDYHFSIIRLLPDGNRDSTFVIPEFKGQRITANPNFRDAPINDVLPLEDGSMLVGGSFRDFKGKTVNGLVRLKEDGSLDTSFQADLGPKDYVSKLSRTSDGGYVVALSGAPHLVKLDAKGARDPGFISPSEFKTVFDLAVDSQGRILVVAYINQGAPLVRLYRLLSDGSRDPEFEFEPIISTDFNVAVQPDDEIVVAGQIFERTGTERKSVFRIHGNDERRLELRRGLDGDSVVRWQSRKARTYKIEESTSLESPEWKAVHTAEGTGAMLQWNGGPNSNAKFFRMRRD